MLLPLLAAVLALVAGVLVGLAVAVRWNPFDDDDNLPHANFPPPPHDPPSTCPPVGPSTCPPKPSKPPGTKPPGPTPVHANCGCPKVWEPVCGDKINDPSAVKRTYSSLCIAKCLGVTTNYTQGICKGKPGSRQCVCAKIKSEPVCVHGMLFRDGCLARCDLTKDDPLPTLC